MSTVMGRGQRMIDDAAGVVDRVADVVARHRESLVWLGALLLLSAIASLINLGGAPARTAGEGSTIQHAIEVLDGRQSVAVPGGLGWGQIAAYAQVTDALGRHTVEVAAGREAMVVATLLGAALVWGIARRLGLSRPAAMVAGILFTLSPLALTLHRIVDVQNVAVPWLLAAVLVLLSRRVTAVTCAIAVLLAVVAILTTDLALVALPVLAWMIARRTTPPIRSRALAAAGGVLLVAGVGWLVVAVPRGVLGTGPAGLVPTLAHTLSGTSGSIGRWGALDAVLIVVAVAAALAALGVGSLRPLGVLTLGLSVVLLRPGAHPGFVDAALLLPFAAILIPAIADLAIRRRTGALRRARLVLVSVTAVTAIAFAVVSWGAPLGTLLTADRDAPARSAVEWMRLDVPKDAVVLADDAIGVDLVAQGRSAQRVRDAIPAATDGSLAWRQADYLVSTRSVRDAAIRQPALRAALAHSVVVAGWGRGTDRIALRRVSVLPVDARSAAVRSFRADASAFGAQVATNPGLTLDPRARRLLIAGQVDPRIPIALAAELATTEVGVVGFPRTAGDVGPLRRQVLISSLGGGDVVNRDGTLTTAARRFVALLDGPFAPVRTDSVRGNLLITYSSEVVAPDGD